MHAEDLLRLGAALLRQRRGRPPQPALPQDPEVSAWRDRTGRARRAGRRATRRMGAGGALAGVGVLLVPTVDLTAGVAVGVVGAAAAAVGWRGRRRSATALERAGEQPVPLPVHGSLASVSLGRLARAEQALAAALRAAPPHLASEVAPLRAAEQSAAAQVRDLSRDVAVLEQAVRVDRLHQARIENALNGLVADLHEGVRDYERLTSAAALLFATARQQQSVTVAGEVRDLTDRLASLAVGVQEAAAVSRRALGP